MTTTSLPSIVARGCLTGLILALSTGCGGFPADKVDLFSLDLDQDGFPQTDESGAVVDCDDTNPLVYPGGAESCDGFDNDCDGTVDGPPQKGADARMQWWPDEDGDGYGDSTQAATRACESADGMVDNNDDCDDTDVASSPDGSEVCDGADNDCNGYTDDDATDESVWYLDNDGDGYGDDAETTTSCDSPPGSWAPEGGDCDDRDASLSPGEPEDCDGIDNDCDDEIDEEPEDGLMVWTDLDGDGYGDPATETTVCDGDSDGYVVDNTDCDDSDPTAYPGSLATEVPFDGTDQDCDGNDFCTDLDCDGLPDLVVPWYGATAEEPRQAQLLLSGGLRFGEHVFDVGQVGFYGAATAADVDGDGYPDVILAKTRDEAGEPATSSALLYGPFLDDGGGIAPAGERSLILDGAGKLALGDFDADGALDLVAGGTTTSGTHVDIFYGVGSTTGSPDFSIGVDIVSALHVADLDQDGFDDLVVCQKPPPFEEWGYALTVYYGTSGGLAEGPVMPDALQDCVDVDSGNLDGDAELELVLARNRESASSRHLSVWADPTSGGAYALGDSFEVTAAASVQLVDLDQDGALDAVFGAGLDEGLEPHTDDDVWETLIEVYMGSGGGISTGPAAALQGHGPERPLLADFDNDGYVDILAPGQANDDGGTIYSRVYWSTSGAFSGADADLLSWSAWVHGAVADTNGDGHLDVLRFSDDADEGLVRHQGSASGPASSGASLLISGQSVSAPVVVE